MKPSVKVVFLRRSNGEKIGQRAMRKMKQERAWQDGDGIPLKNGYDCWTCKVRRFMIVLFPLTRIS